MPCVWAIFPQGIYHFAFGIKGFYKHIRISASQAFFLLHIDRSMSLPETVTIGQIVLAFARISAASYCYIAGSVFFLYEASITFGDEVEYFWKRGVTGASLLYLSNKYVAVAYHSTSLVSRLLIYDNKLQHPSVGELLLLRTTAILCMGSLLESSCLGP
ncbi:hypothetical protein C8Q74DRAFT_576831 [Fomes fomentarius]|nr:hypothetical protein C8Q74DRAFT_576831 [Fomes fomentarius]